MCVPAWDSWWLLSKVEKHAPKKCACVISCYQLDACVCVLVSGFISEFCLRGGKHQVPKF